MRAVLLCAAFVAAFAVRGDVRLVLEPLRPGEIVARGWLKGQLELSLAGMGGHLGEIEPDQMEKPYVTRDYDPANGARGVVGWCAEMGGEYAIGTAMLAYALDDPALIAKAAARVKAAMALQEPDGYLGAYRPKDNRQEDYNAWGCHWFYDAMLLEYYRTGDKAILDAVHRGLLWFVKNWSGEKKTDYAGPMIIEPASVVYRLTGDKRLLDFCEEYAAWLDRPGHKNGATFTTFPLKRHGYHVAAIAARLKVPAALAYASGKRAFLDAALKSHGDFHDGVGWQATYAPCADGEWVAAPSCVGETEYCDFIFYQQLFAWFASLTGDVGFADATERLVFNAAQGARAKDERTIGYMTSPNQWYATPNSSRWGPEPFYHAYAPNMNAACCPANSISLYPLYVLNAVSREGRDLRVMNYGPYDVRTKIDGADVRVVSETDYPFGQRVTLRVRADGWGGALRLRRPAWAERMAVTRGGKECPIAEKGGVVTVAGPWKGEESVVVDFGWQPKVRAVRDRDFDKEPLKTVEWGALVFAQPVVEKWTRVERPKPTWGKDSAPPQPKEWPWLAISCEKEPVAYALPQGLSPADIRVERTGMVGLPWQKPPVRLVVPMLRASAAYPTENRREPGVGSKYKGTHTPIPAAGLVEPDPGARREPVELVPFGATCLRTTCFPVALMSMGAFAAVLPEAEGDLTWGGRKAHPAVVNPVVAADGGDVISLRGDWEFSPQEMRAPWRNGIWTHFYREKSWPGLRTIRVPGCWEAQGVGEPGEGECWDAKWDHNAKPIRHKHMGDGWYRKTVEIPASWEGKRIWLKVGGVKSKGWFWVNESPVALVDNYCGTYKYDVTDLVTPGSTATVVAQVNNLAPSRKGLFSAMHRWGGIYRDVELEATPRAFIDDAWVRGLFDEKSAEVHVDIGGLKVEGVKLKVTIDGRVVEQTTKPPNHQTIKLPLADFRPWSPEHPNLYTARVDLVENGKVVHTRLERFGVRKFEVRGKEFYLNGKPFYVRGFGDDHVYPLTGITPPDRDLHRAHLAKARAAGFNFVRLHTHTELPEYYEAADELGIMIQPELPYYSDVPTEGFEFDPKRDVTELYRHFRRHPSFAVYSMGNEGSFGKVLDARLHAYVKSMDPDRLKINQDCQAEKINPPEVADYLGGPIKPWPRGSFDPERPFVTHEYLNLCIKCDSRDEPLYTGVWEPPATRKGRAEWLAKFGLDHTWGDRLQDAQNALQRHYQKQGVEAARADPYCDGHIFWTIVDVVVAQSGAYTAQGLFSPFWEPKRGGFSPAEFAQLNSPSCLLLDVPDTKRVFTSGDTLDADFLFAHFGDAPLKGASLTWRLDPTGTTGVSPVADEIPLGPAQKVATAKITFPVVSKPAKATLTATLGGVSNSWDFWVFPRRAKHDGSGIAAASQFHSALAKRYDGLLPETEAALAKVVVAAYGSPLAAEALARGQRVVTLAGMDGKPNVSLGWWWMGKQVGTAMANHPALAALPHEGILSPLIFRLVLQGGKPLPYSGLAQEDMLMVGEGGEGCFLYLGQGKVGPGKALMAFGLKLLADTPEAAALMDGLLDYAASDRFTPASEIGMAINASQNGWGRTIRAGDTSESLHDVMEGYSRMVISRALAGQTELVWETRPVPQTVRAKPTFDITFAGGMGYPQQPQAAFALSLNGKKVIDIPEIVWKDHEWKGGGCTLRYKRDTSTDELGIFTLTVPSSMLAPGKPATLGVTAEAKGSRRWFAVMEL